ncbi:hypothetical protein EC844_101430 [Acinetobacter calcoaceticus]|uniref:Uncharacterized protein n=1 Tax=Acinetobacter calcoaceticus TaxID=471 RepID=A0A4R1Y5Y3_ACICA|nr:hypothetical protein EC844_101430 [Acinetobacter calcoaceticus]
MINPDQKKMFDVLALQRQQQKSVDRILKIVLPITALLISTICANWTLPSTVGTFVALVIAFYAVGIWRQNLYLWLGLVTLYCLIDIYLTFQGAIPIQAFGRQAGTMLTFTGILGIGRPYIDRWMMKSV